MPSDTLARLGCPAGHRGRTAQGGGVPIARPEAVEGVEAVCCCSSVAAVDVWTVARWSAVVVLLLVGVPLLGGVWWWCVVCRKKYKYTTKKLYKNLVI